MPTPTRHYPEEIQAWLDGRLDASIQVELERHLKECRECQREHHAILWTRQQIAGATPTPELPPGLEARIVQAIRAEAVRPQVIPAPPTPAHWRIKGWHWAGMASAAALVIGLVILARPARGTPRMPIQMTDDFFSYQQRQFPLDLQTGDTKQLEAFFVGRGVSFNTRVFDLGMMEFQLVGGRVQSPGRSSRALFVYRGPKGRTLVCQMYRGQVGDLPPGATVHEHKGLRFYSYEARGVTAVFWQEGAVVCALTSDLPPGDLLQLAFAKATA